MGQIFEVGEVVSVQFGHIDDPAHEKAVFCRVVKRKLSRLGIWRAEHKSGYAISSSDYVYLIERLDGQQYIGGAVVPDKAGFILATANLYATNTGHPKSINTCSGNCRASAVPCLKCGTAKLQLTRKRIANAYESVF